MKTNLASATGKVFILLKYSTQLLILLVLFVASAGAEFSWREHRMNLVEAALEKNKQRFKALGFRQERYLAALASDPNKSNPALVVARFSAQALARTIKYNQDMAAIDRELEDDYKQWSTRTGRGSMPEWRETPSAKDLTAYALRARITLRVAYTADIKKLEREVLRGEDGILKQMNNEREDLLQERRILLEELDFLRTHREDEVRARPSLADRDAGFHFAIVGPTERYVNIGDTEEVEFSITPGSISTTLTVLAEDGAIETIALAPAGRFKWSYQFAQAGNKSRLFILEDNSIPRRSSTVNVVFFVRDVSPQASPLPQSTADTQGPVITIESHNASQPWSRVSQGTITLSGRATDMGRGDNGIHAVYINNSLVDIGGTATGGRMAPWRETLKLATGWNRISVEAYDNSPIYNKSEEMVWVYYRSPDAVVDDSGDVQPPEPPTVLTAELDCGDSFELAPGDFVGKGCILVVRGWHNTDERVFADVDYDERSGIEVFPKVDSQHPMNMSDPGFSVYPDRYFFSLSFRAKKNAPPGVTPITITAGQAGSGRVVLRLWIAVLEEGLLPSRGSGIRPPAEVVTGSGGEYCVWRYKSFGDRPECFNFLRAACDTSRYAAPRYELVGSAMTWRESGVRMAQLGSYHEDAYGCHAWQDTEEGRTGGGGAEDPPGPPRVPDDPPDDRVNLPDFTGKMLGETKRWIQDNNLKAIFQPGTPAPTADRTGTVEKQHPAPSTLLNRGSTVSLTIHSRYVDSRKIPDVTGLSLGEARARVQAANLNAVMQPGSEPQSQALAGHVEQQDPPPGMTVSAGSTVTLFVYGPFVDKAVVPDVQNLLQGAARTRLEAAGLIMDRRDAGRPAESRLAHTAQKQEPAAGTSLAKGSVVVVWVYDQYAASQEEQVAAANCSQYLGSLAYWDDTVGGPRCGCFDGLVWNLEKTQCVTADVHANELCARDLPGSVATGRDASGRFNCDCPQGYVWADNPRRCIKGDASRCELYARTAVAHNQQNLANRCGFTGARWSDDYQGHYGWCLTVSQEFADSESQARAEGLNRCISPPPVQPSCTLDTAMISGASIYCSSHLECHDTECKVTTLHIVNEVHFQRGFKTPPSWGPGHYNSCERLVIDARKRGCR